MLAALDLATDMIYYRIRDRKRHREFLDLPNPPPPMARGALPHLRQLLPAPSPESPCLVR
jgi:hypothetical protein